MSYNLNLWFKEYRHLSYSMILFVNVRITVQANAPAMRIISHALQNVYVILRQKVK